MDNLPEIRDIYIPESVSIFPLAYGWWVILSAFILFIVFIKFFIWGIRKSRKIYALNQLKKINVVKPVPAAVQMSELLRRICHFKYKEATALYGKEWLEFLNTHSSKEISGDEAKLLVYAPFMQQEDMLYSVETATKLKSFCRQWIGANL